MMTKEGGEENGNRERMVKRLDNNGVETEHESTKKSEEPDGWW